MTAQAEWADLVEVSAASVAGLVARAPESTDWTAIVPGMEWSLERVVEHVADSFVWYGGQLLRGRLEGWPPWSVKLDGDITPDSLGDLLIATSRVLAGVVRSAPADALGFHPYGIAGPRDSAAMGCVEVLVHGEDLRRGLDATWTPPREPVVAVLGHLFSVSDAGADPWGTLLDRCGRTGDDDWRWYNTGS
ncbi:MAG: maleylpyruvate isomerase N-terminal domain-containing protein [Candidatus Nanopelagicales bacterium]